MCAYLSPPPDYQQCSRKFVALASLLSLAIAIAMQDTLDQSVVDQMRDRSESEIHFHTLKDVRQLGANSSSFPSAAEVVFPSVNDTCHNKLCCTELLELHIPPWCPATTSCMQKSYLIIIEQYGRTTSCRDDTACCCHDVACSKC